MNFFQAFFSQLLKLRKQLRGSFFYLITAFCYRGSTKKRRYKLASAQTSGQTKQSYALGGATENNGLFAYTAWAQDREEKERAELVAIEDR